MDLDPKIRGGTERPTGTSGDLRPGGKSIGEGARWPGAEFWAQEP